MSLNAHVSMKELTATGFSEAQAEAVTSMVKRTREIDAEALATRSGIPLLQSDLAHAATKADLGELRSDIVKWMFGAMGFQTLVVLAAVAGLYRLHH